MTWRRATTPIARRYGRAWTSRTARCSGTFDMRSAITTANVLALTSDRREEFRALFGDETISYEAALQRHYSTGSGQNWQGNFISAYATMHPLEDFAEVFGHFLHIADTLQTAEGVRAHLRRATAWSARGTHG